jgi:hypothetical protein
MREYGTMSNNVTEFKIGDVVKVKPEGSLGS